MSKEHKHSFIEVATKSGKCMIFKCRKCGYKAKLSLEMINKKGN